MIYFCLKPLYQDKDTCAIRLGFGHLNKEEIEIVVKN
jgi:GntR family transcriptional regulator/MocR family aminotransferase